MTGDKNHAAIKRTWSMITYGILTVGCVLTLQKKCENYGHALVLQSFLYGTEVILHA